MENPLSEEGTRSNVKEEATPYMGGVFEAHPKYGKGLCGGGFHPHVSDVIHIWLGRRVGLFIALCGG